MAKRSLLLALAGVLACFIFLSCASSAPPAAATSSITIVNSTGYEVWYVFVSPVDSDQWGDDILASDQVLPNGESFIYELPKPLHTNYDIRLIDLDDDAYIKWSVNVTEKSMIIFTFDDIVSGD